MELRTSGMLSTEIHKSAMDDLIAGVLRGTQLLTVAIGKAGNGEGAVGENSSQVVCWGNNLFVKKNQHFENGVWEFFGTFDAFVRPTFAVVEIIYV